MANLTERAWDRDYQAGAGLGWLRQCPLHTLHWQRLLTGRIFGQLTTMSSRSAAPVVPGELLVTLAEVGHRDFTTAPSITQAFKVFLKTYQFEIYK